MIRLYCLAQGMKRMSTDEVNALIKGNEYYSKLIRTLPWIEPCRSRFDMFQCMMMSGISRREFRSVLGDEVPCNSKLTRVKNYPYKPDAYVVDGHQLLDDDTYITTAQSLWWSVLEPLQLGKWAQEEPTPLVKMYWCQQKARANAYLLIKAASVINPMWEVAINNLQSMTKISHMDCLLEWNQTNYPDSSRGQYFMWFDKYDTYYHFPAKEMNKYSHPDVVKHVYEMYYSMADLIDEIYLFLYHCNMFGFVNNEMMEGDWLYES